MSKNSNINIDVSFGNKGWLEYQYWQKSNHKIYKRINKLIKSIIRDGVLKGIGKPELLRYRDNYPIYSRRITQKHRLTYTNYNGILVIVGCKNHYE